MPVVLHLTPPPPKTYKVFIASVWTPEGIYVVVAADLEDLIWKVSDYCMDCWDELPEGSPSSEGLTPDEIVATYFDHHPSEYWDDTVRYVQSLASE